MFRKIFQEMVSDMEESKKFWESFDDPEYIDTQVNLLNKPTYKLLLLYDYLESCAANKHRDSLLSKLINEFDNRVKGQVPEYLLRNQTPLFSKIIKDLKKKIRERREYILREDFRRSKMELLPGKVKTPEELREYQIKHREDILKAQRRERARGFLWSEREKINSLRRDRGKERQLRQWWDSYVVGVQLKELFGSEK